MPSYHFQISPESSRAPAEIECADLQAAKELAVKLAAHAMADMGTALFDDDFSLKVSDDAGLTLFCIHTVTTDIVAPNR